MSDRRKEDDEEEDNDNEELRTVKYDEAIEFIKKKGSMGHSIMVSLRSSGGRSWVVVEDTTDGEAVRVESEPDRVLDVHQGLENAVKAYTTPVAAESGGPPPPPPPEEEEGGGEERKRREERPRVTALTMWRLPRVSEPLLSDLIAGQAWLQRAVMDIGFNTLLMVLMVDKGVKDGEDAARAILRFRGDPLSLSGYVLELLKEWYDDHMIVSSRKEFEELRKAAKERDELRQELEACEEANERLTRMLRQIAMAVGAADPQLAAAIMAIAVLSSPQQPGGEQQLQSPPQEEEREEE